MNQDPMYVNPWACQAQTERTPEAKILHAQVRLTVVGQFPENVNISLSKLFLNDDLCVPSGAQATKLKMPSPVLLTSPEYTIS